MSRWIQLGPKDKEGCIAKIKLGQKYIDIKTECDAGYGESAEDTTVILVHAEALALACQLPEVKALIKWAFDVRDILPKEEAWALGVDVLKPFEEENNG